MSTNLFIWLNWTDIKIAQGIKINYYFVLNKALFKLIYNISSSKTNVPYSYKERNSRTCWELKQNQRKRSGTVAQCQSIQKRKTSPLSHFWWLCQNQSSFIMWKVKSVLRYLFFTINRKTQFRPHPYPSAFNNKIRW